MTPVNTLRREPLSQKKKRKLAEYNFLVRMDRYSISGLSSFSGFFGGTSAGKSSGWGFLRGVFVSGGGSTVWLRKTLKAFFQVLDSFLES